MTGWTAVVTLACASTLLVWSGIDHRRRSPALKAVLVAQRVLPYLAVGPASAVLGYVETVAGALGIAAACVATEMSPGMGMAASWVIGSVYLGLAGYTVLVLRRSPDAPCGCFGDSGPVSAAIVCRAGLLGASLMLTGPWLHRVQPGAWTISALIVGMLLAAFLRQLPGPRAVASHRLAEDTAHGHRDRR